MRYTKTIPASFFRAMIVLLLATLTLVSLVWIQDEYSAFKDESRQLRERYLQEQRSLLRGQVSSVVAYVEYMKEETERRLHDSLRNRVEEACEIAGNIYRNDRDNHSRSELMKIVKDALRPIRFNEGRGYFFAFNFEGVEELFPDRPELEGRNMLPVRGGNGEYVVKGMLDLVNKQGQGFYRYTWSKPNEEGGGHLKLAYLKTFEPFGWVIGAGEYLDDARRRVQAETLKRVVDLRFGVDGYFFGSRFDGGPLFSNGKITVGTGSIKNLTDPNGVKIFLEYREAALKPGGGFVEYVWPRLDYSRPGSKLSYVQGVQDWDWIIGAGVYLDVIDDVILHEKSLLKKRLWSRSLKAFLVLIGMAALVFILARLFTARIQTGVGRFIDFFDKAARESVMMDARGLSYQEFRRLAVSANKMVADRRRAQQDFEDALALLRAVVEQSPVPMVVRGVEDAGRGILNTAAKLLLEVEDNPVLGDEFWSGLNGKWRILDNGRFIKPDKSPLEIAGAGSTVQGVEYLIIGIDGSARWTTVYAAPIFSGDGRILAVFIVFPDITERKAAEEERKQLEGRLKQAQKMEAVGVLAGGIAHDFNNILAAIIGYTELALMEREFSTIRVFLKNSLKSSERARDLVKQILTFSRKDNEEKSAVDAVMVINEGIDLLVASLPRSVRIEKEAEMESCNILANAGQLNQVLINLATNASHALEGGGGTLQIKQSVTTEPPDGVRPGRYYRLSVCDNGVGMDAGTRERIFEPFFTTKEVGQGTGMGLAVVHGIVMSHGGGIKVESVPNAGSCFHIYLPVYNGEKNESAEGAGRLEPGMENIILLDDEVDLLNAAAENLRRMGYRVRAESDPLRVLELFESGADDCDLVITDMSMQDMSGLELSARILEIKPELPIILCTGFSDKVDRESAGKRGIKEFIYKPYFAAELSEAIRRVLDAVDRSDG